MARLKALLAPLAPWVGVYGLTAVAALWACTWSSMAAAASA